MKLRDYRKVVATLSVIMIALLVGSIILSKLGLTGYALLLLFLSLFFLILYLVCYIAYARCPHCHRQLRHMIHHCTYCGGSLDDEQGEPQS